MAEKFRGKYRIASARAQWWDYGWSASYFVTICTKDRTCFFGDVSDGVMQLSETGFIAHQRWLDIPAHFPFADLNEFIVMPNHVHGIVVINQMDHGRYRPCGENGTEMKNDADMDDADMDDADMDGAEMDDTDMDDADMDDADMVETRLIASLPYPFSYPYPLPNTNDSSVTPPKSPGGFAGRKNPMMNENLSKIIRWYKGRTSFECRKIIPGFKWQSRFHDHIIRNDQEFRRITTYIKHNPAKWNEDKFFLL